MGDTVLRYEQPHNRHYNLKYNVFKITLSDLKYNSNLVIVGVFKKIFNAFSRKKVAKAVVGIEYFSYRSEKYRAEILCPGDVHLSLFRQITPGTLV